MSIGDIAGSTAIQQGERTLFFKVGARKGRGGTRRGRARQGRARQSVAGGPWRDGTGHNGKPPTQLCPSIDSHPTLAPPQPLPPSLPIRALHPPTTLPPPSPRCRSWRCLTLLARAACCCAAAWPTWRRSRRAGLPPGAAARCVAACRGKLSPWVAVTGPCFGGCVGPRAARRAPPRVRALRSLTPWRPCPQPPGASPQPCPLSRSPRPPPLSPLPSTPAPWTPLLTPSPLPLPLVDATQVYSLVLGAFRAHLSSSLAELAQRWGAFAASEGGRLAPLVEAMPTR
jgi:hypothetical protein